MMQSAVKTHWKKMDNPDYIGAWAFQPGEEKIVTMKAVRYEMVTGAEGKKEECRVAHFVENEKPLILNTTNSKTIERVCETPYIEEWVGKSIALGVERVKAFGDVVDAVRVKKKKVASTVKLVCEACGEEIKAVGQFAAAQIAQGTKRSYGAALCYACGQMRKTADKAAGTQGAAQASAEPPAVAT